MKKNLLNLLLAVVICSWATAARADKSVTRAQILIDAGYSYNEACACWNGADGKKIDQAAIVKLFSENVIELTAKLEGSTRMPTEAERDPFLDAVKREIGAGHIAFSVGKPEAGQVAVASLTKEEIRDAVAANPAANGAFRSASAFAQTVPWDGKTPLVTEVKGGGSSGGSSHSSGGGGSSRSSGGGSSGRSSGGGSSGRSSSGGSSGRSSGGGSSGRSSGGGSSGRSSTSAPRSGGSASKPSTGGSSGNRQTGKTPATTNPSTGNRQTGKTPTTTKPSTGTGGNARQPAKNPVVGQKPLAGGGKQETRKDGTVKTTRPVKGGGSEVVVKRPNGDASKTINDGKGNKTQITERVNPRTGKKSVTEVRTGKDGTRETLHANGARSERRKDGTKVHTSPNGNKVTVSKYQTDKNGHATRTKTTIINNRSVHVTNNYHTVYRGGHSYHSYSPFYHSYLYSPLWYPFYYHPWSSPYYYGWGWYPYSYYSWYYTPYPYYTSPFFWLTDYVIRDAIYSSYQRNQGSSESSEQSQPSQEQQRQAISEEVKAQVAAQVEQAMKDLEAKRAPVLEKSMNTNTVFVVNEEMAVTQTGENGEDGEACSLESGDLIKLAAVPTDSDVVATMRVVSSKSGGCDAKSTVSMSMENVQEMFNEFNERLEKGVAKMKEEKEAGTLKIGK